MIDWPSYNQSLVRRGQILLDYDVLEDWDHELSQMNHGKVGEPYVYPDSFIQLLGYMRVYFHSMAVGNTINEVISLMPKVKDTFQKYVRILKERKVPLEQLIFTKRLSKDYNEYQIKRNTVESTAINLLANEGKFLKAGELLRYVITDFYQRYSTTRAVPIELIDMQKANTTYDIKRYTELLSETCISVTKPFGYTLPMLISPRHSGLQQSRIISA